MKKIAIVYGRSLGEVGKRAVEELSRTLLDYTLEYPVCREYDDAADMSEFKLIYIGTKKNNGYIEKNSKRSLLKKEEYFISVKNNITIIEGSDEAGMLYGALDFYNKYIVKFEHPDTDKYWINLLTNENLPDFEYGSAPSINERGLWTWGHVIYDYRGYIDNMMKLKMNSVIIWNDFVPANAKEIVDYAHARNIKVILGFAWMWDTHCDRFDIKNLSGNSEEIVEKYEKEYAGLGADGIYFQTFTELESDNIDGVCIASAAADFVNNTASLLYKKHPDIEIQFGLHASSVKNKLEFIKTVDQRIRIVWENCGSFPFSYIPKDVATFDETKEFVNRISRLRGEDDCFGVVTKGLVKLDWPTFEHLRGPQCIGISSELMKENRIIRKRRIWRYIQAGWMNYGDKAYEMIREMQRIKGGNLSSYALVEDGMFEENIMYPVALYAEMLWNCASDIKTLSEEVALRSYVRFA